MEKEIFNTGLIFARVAGALMFFPGFGEKYILSRANLVIAVFTSLILVNLHTEFPPIPESPIILLFYMFGETIIGMIIGLAAQIIFLSMHIVGALMSVQSGLSASNVFDPSQGEQVPIVTNLLMMFSLAAIFATDTHHLLFLTLEHSYQLFPLGQIFSTSDMAEFIISIISKSLLIGLKLSAAFIIVNTAITVGNGILSRLMPSFQVFFVMTPIQILILLLLLLVTLNHMTEILIINIQETLGAFAALGSKSPLNSIS